LLCSFSLQLIFFSEQPFYVNYSILTHLPTRQDGVENRDKVYENWFSLYTGIRLIFKKVIEGRQVLIQGHLFDIIWHWRWVLMMGTYIQGNVECELYATSACN